MPTRKRRTKTWIFPASCANRSVKTNTRPLTVASALARVRDSINAAANRAGRDPQDVTLVAVTKGVGLPAIRQAIAAGQTDFGENRAQEMSAKVSEIEEPVRWHFIGRLQTNKVKDVIGPAHIIHSVDRLALAQQIGQRAAGPISILLQVNTSGEQTKAGVAPQEALATIEQMLQVPNLNPSGLMTMAPLHASENQVRRSFRLLAGLRDLAVQEFGPSIHHLSMGMSQDYEVAIQEGATMVRIGSAIFMEEL